MGLRQGGGSFRVILCENEYMIAVEVQHYLSRARDFLKGMDLLKDDLTGYRYSPALLGIHSAISYSDALRTGMGCTDVSADDHRNAARDLKSRLSARKYEDQKGAEKLDHLLGKTRKKIAYFPEASDVDEIKSVVLHVERFASWAEKTGKQLNIAGW